MDERYHLYSSSSNFYCNEDPPDNAERGCGTVTLGGQGRQGAFMNLSSRKSKHKGDPRPFGDGGKNLEKRCILTLEFRMSEPGKHCILQE
jgi:hypothetical protein